VNPRPEPRLPVATRKTPTRECGNCKQLFVPLVGEAGTKYCSLQCKREGYLQGYFDPNRPLRPVKVAGEEKPREEFYCGMCGQVARGEERKNHMSSLRGMHRDRRTPMWPYTCTGCLSPLRAVIKRLKSHHVPYPMVLQLLRSPYCEVCKVDILTPVALQGMAGYGGYPRPLLTVDHDHSCCPAHTSCGACVRGMLCIHCNAAEGMIRSDPAIANALAAYLNKPSTVQRVAA